MNILKQILEIIFEGKVPFYLQLRKMAFYATIAVPFTIPFAVIEYDAFGAIGLVFLVFTMYIRPLADIFTDTKLLKKLIPFRKEMGILSAVFIIGHAFGYFVTERLESTWVYFDISQHFFWAIIATIAGIICLITSNNASIYALGKYWKWVQKFSHLFFIGGVVHVMLLGEFETFIGGAFLLASYFGIRFLAVIGFKIHLKDTVYDLFNIKKDQ